MLWDSNIVFEVLRYNMNLLPMSNIYCCYVYTCSVSVYECLKVVLWPRLFWTCSNRLPCVITCCDERNKSATISTMNPAWVRILNLYVVVVQTSKTRAKSTCHFVQFNHYTTIKIYLYQIKGYNTCMNRYQPLYVECQFYLQC